MEGPRDKKNKRIAFLVSAALHTSLFLTFFFLISWRAPYPPAPEYGMEVNYGLDDQGGGEVQPDSPVGNPNADSKDVEQKSADKAEDVQPVKETQQQVTEQKDEKVLSDETSDVEVKTKKAKEEDHPKEKVEVKKDKPADQVKPVIKKEAVYTGNTGEKKGETNQSHGDDPGKVGDKGNSQGKLDAKALYGKPGGGNNGDGFGLAMAGWEWASTPKAPELPDNENGTIEFEIICDENGDIKNIKTISRGLSLRAEQLLKAEIQKNSLIRTSSGQVPAESKGRVVFVLKTK